MNKNTHGHVMPEHRRQRWALRKLSVGMCSVLLGFAVMIPTVPAVGAAEIFAVSDVGIGSECRSEKSWILRRILRLPVFWILL